MRIAAGRHLRWVFSPLGLRANGLCRRAVEPIALTSVDQPQSHSDHTHSRHPVATSVRALACVLPRPPATTNTPPARPHRKPCLKKSELSHFWEGWEGRACQDWGDVGREVLPKSLVPSMCVLFFNHEAVAAFPPPPHLLPLDLLEFFFFFSSPFSSYPLFTS